jgi:hypothetical protein
MLYSKPISRWIRKSEFWSLLFMLLFEGNVQQFTFYEVNEWKNVFVFSLGSKMIKIHTILFGFVLTLISACLMFLSYGFYVRLNKHVMDNNKNYLMGHLFFILQFGLRNFIYGILHSILRPFPYYHMLGILLGF